MGGKTRVAREVWRRFGDVPNLVEPFFGSGAILLGRPPFEGNRIETVNDLDGHIANFWRALQADPDAVAYYADWPVSELDLHARGDWLYYRPDARAWVRTAAPTRITTTPRARAGGCGSRPAG
jgi:DNA adenine methylase